MLALRKRERETEKERERERIATKVYLIKSP
jgi:hypothetical protein